MRGCLVVAPALQHECHVATSGIRLRSKVLAGGVFRSLDGSSTGVHIGVVLHIFQIREVKNGCN